MQYDNGLRDNGNVPRKIIDVSRWYTACFDNLLRDVSRYYVAFYRASDQFDLGRSCEANLLCCFVLFTCETKSNAMFDEYWIPRDSSCRNYNWHEQHAIYGSNTLLDILRLNASQLKWLVKWSYVVWPLGSAALLNDCPGWLPLFVSLKKETSNLGQSLCLIRW